MIKKIILPIIIGVLLLAGVIVGIYLVRQQQDIREKAAPATVLNFTPSQDTMKVGDTKVITVSIDTGTNVVGAIQLNMVYDPSYLSVVPTTFIRGTFFKTDLKIPTVASGRLTMAAGGQIGNFPTGTGQVASFTVTALQAGSTVIAFDSAQTQVSGTGSDKNTNVLLVNQLGTSSLTILASAVPTATPTPTGGAAPVTATPTPSTPAGATATLTLTPTPTTAGGGGNAPTSTATPTPSTAAGTTATPTPTLAAGTTATPTPTRTKAATATPTKVAAGSSLPQAGTGTTTVIFLISGLALAILGMLLLAL
ncbi:MAG: cohesin domain-containing protein [bacterium]|nr:cohesin domain-containing protein [bacterium]